MENNLFTPYKLGPITLRNRTVRSAAFENMAENHTVSEMLYNYHTSVARGGVGMTTVAYASISQSGLSFENQLWLRKEIVPDLKWLTDAIHKEGAAASVQLGHCGNMSHPRLTKCIPLSASNGINIYSPTLHRRINEREMIAIAKDFGKAVKIAMEGGFDCVEVHSGHGYLISQFLSPYTNRRRDEYGGSLQNRMKFMKMCMNEVLEAAAGKIAVVSKINMRDGFKGGNDIEANIEIAKELQAMNLDALVLSGGFVSRAPMYVMKGSMPIKSLTHYMHPWWLRWGVKSCGWFMMPSEPFKELFFLEDALKFRQALQMPLVYVGGIVRKENAERALECGFQLVQMGRALLRDPDFVNKMKSGVESCGCGHSNYCIGRMYSKEMACHHNLKEPLPAKLIKEIEQLESR